MINRYDTISKFIRGCRTALAAAAVAAALLLAAGCGGGGGGGGGGGDDPVPPPDTIAPTVSFSEPADGAEYILNVDMPSRISLAYSDSGGVNIQTLSVTFTLNQRTVDLTGSFTKSASSATAESLDLSSLTTASAYTGVGFGTFTSATVAIPGNPSQCDFRADATAGKLFLFCPSDESSPFQKITVIGSSGAATEVATTFPVKSFAAASAEGKYYAARADANAIAVFSTGNNSLLPEISPLDGEPEDISYNASENRLYVTYDGSNRVDYVNCSTDTIAGGFTMSNPFSEMRAAFSGAGFLLMTQKTGQFWFQTYDGGGARTADAQYGMTLPGDIEWLDAAATDYHYFSDTLNNQLFYYDSAQDAISTASLPFKASAMFADRSGTPDVLYVVSSDGETVRDFTSGTDYSAPAPVITGEVLSGKKYLLENIWQIDTQVSGTLTATVRDNSGNTGSKSITLKFTPESQAIRLAR